MQLFEVSDTLNQPYEVYLSDTREFPLHCHYYSEILYIRSGSIRITDPIFEAQTKNKLGNTDVKYWIETTVKNALIDWMLKHPEDANLLLEKVVRNQEIRKEIQKVQKKGKDMAKNCLTIP